MHMNSWSNGPGELYGISFRKLVHNIEKLFLELFIQWLIQENVLVSALVTHVCFTQFCACHYCLSSTFFYMAFTTIVMRLCYFFCQRM